MTSHPFPAGEPLLSIVILTYNRPQLLERAVRSALSQTVQDLEVIVIDDGSSVPVNLPEHPKLRVVRLPENRGLAAARNAGAQAARGRWISYLDDDDELLPCFAEVSLDALAQSSLPSPVLVLSGLEVIEKGGRVIETHVPPTLPRGSLFNLEPIPEHHSFFPSRPWL